MKYIKQSLCCSLALIPVLFFNSCVEVDDSDTNKAQPVNSSSYLSIAVNLGEILSGTRSGDITGTADELKIHSVRVVLYDGSDKITSDGNRTAQYTFEYNITSGSWSPAGNPTPSGWVKDNSTPGEDSNKEGKYIVPASPHLFQQTSGKYEFATYAQRVKYKDYKMLVILNGASKDNTLSGIYKATEIGNYFSEFEKAVLPGLYHASGAIANGKGIIMTNHQGLIDVKKEMLGKTDQEGNETPVRVCVDRLVAKVSVVHSDDFLRNLPAGLTLGSWKLDIANNETYWMRKSIEGEAIQAPGQSPTMEGLYAEDPNYTSLSSQLSGSVFNNLFENGHLQSSKVNNRFDESEYTFENTMGGNVNLTQLTRVVVGYTYSPPELPAGSSYFVYKNKIITPAELTKYRSAIDDSEIPSYLSGIRAVLRDKYIDTLTYNLQGTGTDFYEVYGLRFCPQGRIYYTIPIRHFDVNVDVLGHYGVVRNNIYQITINSINPPGIGGPALSANINIQPWAGRSQTNSIGVKIEGTMDNLATIRVFYESLTEKEPNSSEPLNLYKKWMEMNPNIIPVPEYRVETVEVGTEVSASEMEIDMSAFSHYFDYSIPLEPVKIRNSEEPYKLTLYYARTASAGGTLGSLATVYFTDEDGRPLYIHNPQNNEPGGYGGQRIRIPIFNGEVYLSQLKEAYLIYNNSDKSIEYQVKDRDFIRMIDIEKSTASGQFVFLTNYLPDPVQISSSSSILIAIICKRKQ